MNIINSFDEYLLQAESYRKKTHNPSDLTSCLRQLYYKWNGVEKSNPPTAGNIIKMKFGHLAEDMLAEWLDWRVERGEIKSYQRQVEILAHEKDLEIALHGYQDFIVKELDGSETGIELKSSYGRGIKEVQVSGEPKEDYIIQNYTYLRYGTAKRYHQMYLGRDNGYRTAFYLEYRDGKMTCNGRPLNIDWDYYMGRMQLSESTIGGEIPPDREFNAAIKDGEVRARFQRNNKEYKSDWQCNYCDWRDKCWKPLIEESKRGKMFYGEEEVK